MPTSIKLQIMMGGTYRQQEIAMLDIEIPG